MPSPKTVKFKRIRQAIHAQQEAGLPFAVFRKPGQQELWTVFQDEAGIAAVPQDDSPGFLAMPFEPGLQALWIRADRICTTPFPPAAEVPAGASPLPDPMGQDVHVRLVEEALRAIGQGNLEKVVLARRFTAQITGTHWEVYKRLLAAYPNAFCYFWYHPDLGSWMGASPELLLDYRDQMLRTVSLAGTRVSASGETPEFRAKEVREQELVTQYIQQAMATLGLEPDIQPVRPVRAGRVWHLKTELAARATRSQAMALVGQLHPTPAVCGIPLQAAREFIGQHENFRREFYTGYLGPVGITGMDTLSLYVNLRCMQFWEGAALVYVGGGITDASDPAQEWEETCQKSTTMLSVLQNS